MTTTQIARKHTTFLPIRPDQGVRILVAIAAFVAFVGAMTAAASAENLKPASAPAAVFTRLHSFCNKANCSDGAGPSGLIQGLDGNFYGTAGGGTVTTACPYGCGIIFKMRPSGVVTTLYSFCSQANCADGTNPTSLTLGDDGNFYGVTEAGGTANSNCPAGCGTIFRITPGGALTTLYDFNNDDVYYPWIPTQVVRGTDGTLYGATGLLSFQQFFSQLFTITPQGAATFSGGGSVASQVAFQAADGSLYTTNMPTCDQYCTAEGGWISQTALNGTSTTLYNFCPAGSNCTYSGPGSLIQGADGNFYGTVGTINNSCPFNYCGAVYQLTPSGNFTAIYTFCSLANCADGTAPGGLLQATDGNYYGETSGNPNTLFQLTPAGTLTTLYTFCAQRGCGFLPTGPIQATDGNFYGTTYEGGYKQWGIAYRLSTGLGPFVRTLPGSGAIGSKVRILGTNLTGATAVRFNGVPAKFEVSSKTYITATVPAGTTTGTVTVTTPSGALSSNVVFEVPR